MTLACSGLPFLTNNGLVNAHKKTSDNVVAEVCFRLLFVDVKPLHLKLQFSFQFKSKRKLGGPELLKSYVKVLETEMDDQLYVFRAKNNDKIKATKTIALAIIGTAATLIAYLILLL